jgi:hypothetical protein
MERTGIVELDLSASADNWEISDKEGDGPLIDPLDLPRRCLVTVGATAGFRSLLLEITQPHFLAELKRLRYTILEVQCGPDLDWFKQYVGDVESRGLDIHPFDFCPHLAKKMRHCTYKKNSRRQGVVICHGGAVARSVTRPLRPIGFPG